MHISPQQQTHLLTHPRQPAPVSEEKYLHISGGDVNNTLELPTELFDDGQADTLVAPRYHGNPGCHVCVNKGRYLFADILDRLPQKHKENKIPMTHSMQLSSLTF